MPNEQKVQTSLPARSRKRRRCQNCNRLYQPVRDDQKFCRDNQDPDKCRKEFYRYGSSYGPLKTGLHKAIDKKYAQLRDDFRREIKDQSLRIGRLEELIIHSKPNTLRVEFEKLRAEIDSLRGQYKEHTHVQNQDITDKPSS